MASSRNPQFDDGTDEEERRRLEQEELQRQLQGAPGAGLEVPSAAAATESADDEPSNFTSGMVQRGNQPGAGVRAAGGALSGAGTGATVGSILPGVGTAVGAGVGAVVGGITGLFNRHASTAATDYSVDDARKAITDAYTQFNGHAPDPAEVDTMIRGQGWKPGDRFVGSGGLNSVINSLRQNAETVKAATAAPNSAAAAAAPPAAASGSGSTGTRKYVEDYFASRGVSPYDTSVDYWTDHIDNAGKYGATADYFKNRLATADEFTGKGPHYDWQSAEGAKGVSGGASAGSGGSTNSLVPSDSDFYNELQQKLISILGGPQALERDALLRQLTGK